MAGPENKIFLGTVGSTAYGLDREGSDVDQLGIFVTPTRDFWKLDWNQRHETWSNAGPENPSDTTLHEVAKYCRLALKTNPSILELLWLPDELVRKDTRWSDRLRGMRHCFLSERSVRSAYGGYARDQVQRLQNRNAAGKEGFSSDTQRRTAKHARHCFRLLRQGHDLLTTGELTIRVPDPQTYWDFDYASVEEIVARFEVEDRRFREARSVLPSQPDTDAVEAYLYDIRRAHLR